MKAPKAPNTQVVEDIKAKLISRILQSVEGLSVRQAEFETGMLYMTISRMRRGIGGRLEDLIEAALNVGVSVDVHKSRKFWTLNPVKFPHAWKANTSRRNGLAAVLGSPNRSPAFPRRS